MTEEMHHRVHDLVESYRRGTLGRRDFVRAVLALGSGMATFAGVLEPLGLCPADAAQVRPDDPDLTSGSVRYRGEAEIGGYLSRPKAPGRHPGVIVIHENTGLVEHIQDVARRFAKEGFAALAPDLLSRAGGRASLASPDEARRAMGSLADAMVDRDLRATFDYLRGLDQVVRDRVGVVGFCWGGAKSLRMATQVPELAAAVLFYGRNPSPLELVERITCPLLLLYGEEDPPIMAGVPALEAALKRAGKRYEIKIYPGARHAFHNDTRDRYHPEASADAWARTVTFFKRHLAA